MALYGILSDIHGNREALGAALGALERRGARPIACLGDVVGYNADPDECVAMVRARCALAVAGDHDLIAARRLGWRSLSNDAEYSLRRTRRALSRDSVSFLQDLPPCATLEKTLALVHASVRNVQQAMAGPDQIRANAPLLAQDFPGARVCFFGSHEQRVYRVRPDGGIDDLSGERLELDPDLVYFINPGTVDASRRSGPRHAECALFDSSDWSVEFLRVPYDSAAAEAKAAVFGYRINPLADRLYSLRRRLAARS
jgi:predicted phosphodiesterase